MAKITKKELNELNEAELFEMAVVHGYKGEQDDATKKGLVDFIYSAENGPEKPGMVEETVKRGGKRYPHFSGKRKKIVIGEGRDGEPSYVFVSINGDYEAQIPRGVECSVPEEVLENLQVGAVEEVTVVDNSGQPTGQIRRIPRFAVQVLGDADPTPGTKAAE